MKNTHELFIGGFNAVAEEIEAWAVRKGWNEDDPRLIPELQGIPQKVMDQLVLHYDLMKQMLFVTEIAEGAEGARHNDPKSDKIPEYTSREEEWADCIIRMMHRAAHENLRVAEALVAKLEYNESRPYKHGKQA